MRWKLVRVRDPDGGELRDTNPPDGISCPGTRVAATLLGLVVCGACAVDASSWTGTTEQIAGVARVMNPPEPLWPPAEAPYIRLELERVFGVDEEPAEAILANVWSLAVDGAGNVYALDRADNRIVAFASDGSVTWSAGRAGEGPGELDETLGIAWDGGERLYVLNQSGTQLDWWGVDGAHEGSLSLSELGIPWSSTLGSPAPGTLALVQGRDELEVVLFAMDPGPRRVGSFVADVGMLRRGGGSVQGDLFMGDGYVSAGNVTEYAFRVYGLDEGLRMVVVRPDTGFVPAVADEETGSLGSMGSLAPPVRLANGYWLTRAHWPTGIGDPVAFLRKRIQTRAYVRHDTRAVLDLFDAEGRWLTNVTWDSPDAPEFGSLRSVGPDGKVYTLLFDPFPQVRRYRVVIEEPES